MKKLFTTVVVAAFAVGTLAIAEEVKTNESPVKHEQPKAEEKAKMENPADPVKGLDMQKSESGLEWQDIKVGTGKAPEKGKTVVVHYTGWLTDGKKFDSSVDRGEKFEFPIGMSRVIKGWDEGVMSMKIGGVRKLFIPANLAYGNRDVGGGLIPANSTLVFQVELFDVK